MNNLFKTVAVEVFTRIFFDLKIRTMNFWKVAWTKKKITPAASLLLHSIAKLSSN